MMILTLWNDGDLDLWEGKNFYRLRMANYNSYDSMRMINLEDYAQITPKEVQIYLSANVRMVEMVYRKE